MKFKYLAKRYIPFFIVMVVLCNRADHYIYGRPM